MGRVKDFGHFSANGPGVHIDGWGAGPFTVTNGKQTWTFEFSDRFGPLLLGKDGEPLEDQPISERHPFWAPFGSWLADFDRKRKSTPSPTESGVGTAEG